MPHAPSRSRCVVAGSAGHCALSGGPFFRIGGVDGWVRLFRHHWPLLGPAPGGVQCGADGTGKLKQAADVEQNFTTVQTRRDPRCGSIRPLHWKPEEPALRVLRVDVPSAILSAHGADHGQENALQGMDWQRDGHAFQRGRCARGSLLMVSVFQAVAFPRRSPSEDGPAAPAAHRTSPTSRERAPTGGCPPRWRPCRAAGRSIA